MHVFQFDHVSLHLFNHVMNARKKVLASFMIARKLLSQRDQRFVIDVQGSRGDLGEAQFGENGTEVGDVFCGLAGGM